jgi:hypothetical protein
MRELHQQLVTGLPLQMLHHLAHRQIGRHRHKKMDMVLAHMPFNYLNIIPPTDLPHQFAHPRPHRPTQHRVTRRPVYLHLDVLPQGFA